MRFNTSLIAIAVLATVAHATLEGQLKTVAEGLKALKFDEKATEADKTKIINDHMAKLSADDKKLLAGITNEQIKEHVGNGKIYEYIDLRHELVDSKAAADALAKAEKDLEAAKKAKEALKKDAAEKDVKAADEALTAAEKAVADAKAKSEAEAKELEAAKAALGAELAKTAEAHHSAAVAASQTAWYMVPFTYPWYFVTGSVALLVLVAAVWAIFFRKKAEEL